MLTMPTRMMFQKHASQEGGTFWTSTATPEELRQVMLHPSGTTKRAAAPGSDDFENSFSSLAYQYIKAKAPKLIDYAIGFQVIKRDDDAARSKGVGVFGFKVGDMWLYVPVFFIQGDLRGHELLWLKSRNTFLPCKENWVNFLINRQPSELGEPAEGSTAAENGVRMPNLRRVFQPPMMGRKFGSYPGWCQGVIPLFAAGDLANGQAKSFRKIASWAKHNDLNDVADESPSALLTLRDLYETYPLIKQGFDKWYGGQEFFARHATTHKKRATDLFEDALAYRHDPQLDPFFDLINPRPNKFHVKLAGDLFADDPYDPVGAGDLEIYRSRGALDGAPVEVKQQFLKYGYAVLDKRAEDKATVVLEREPVQAMNPTKTGMYDVLLASGAEDGTSAKHEECLVLLAPISPRGKAKGILVIKASEPSVYARVPNTDVFVKPDTSENSKDNAQTDEAAVRLQKWLKEKGTATLEEDTVYVAVGPRGHAVGPFKVVTVDEDGKYRVQADFLDPTRGVRAHDDQKNWDPDAQTWNVEVLLNEPGASPTYGPDFVSIPDTHTIVKLEKIPAPKDRMAFSPYKPTPFLPLGNLFDLGSRIRSKRANDEYSVFTDGGEEFKVRVGGRVKKHASAKEAILDLVVRGGLREKAARDAVGLGKAKASHVFPVKRAYARYENTGPDAPALPDAWRGEEPVGPNSIDAIYRQRENVPMPDAVPQTDPMIYDPFYQPDRNMMTLAQQASQSGNKELFDVSVLANLAKTTRLDMMVDRYIGRHMSSIDGLGNTLFHIYNNYEIFADHYGDDDMPKLEDGVRNTFDSLGDLVLYLKEQAVNGGEGMPGTSTDEDASPNISDLS